MLFSVITKNSNWGTLTKNLVIFKMVLRMKNLNIEKLEKLWGSLPKKGAELGHFADLRGGGWQERGVDTPMHTMFIHKSTESTSSTVLSFKIYVYIYINIESILLSLKRNTSIWKIYFLYTSEFENKFICLESLLQVNFCV